MIFLQKNHVYENNFLFSNFRCIFINSTFNVQVNKIDHQRNVYVIPN